jgi:hypothetical protein
MQLQLGYHDQNFKSPTKVDNAVRSARIINYRSSDYAFLRFFPKIDDLVISNYRQADFEPLLPLRNLRHLEIHSAPKVRDWTLLSEFSRLVVLQMTIAAGNWLYGKHQVVRSFAPLVRCQRLHTLVLQGYVPKDGNLLVLADLRKLKYLSVDEDYPMRQLAQFAARRPDITCSVLQPYRLIDKRCKKCQAGLYRLNGSDADHRSVCPVCNEVRLRSHVAKWAHYQK